MKEGKSKLTLALIYAFNEKLTLNLLRVGCDKTNYKIIKRLPTTMIKLQKELDITKMPLNKRVNDLEGVGLLIRKRYEGIVKETKISKKFLRVVDSLKVCVEKNLVDLISLK